MLDWLTQAYIENHSSSRASLAPANYHARDGKYEAVLDELSQLSDISKGNPVVTELQSNTQIALGQFDKAVELISPMVQLEPKSALWLSIRVNANANASMNDIVAVGRDIDYALRADPRHAPPLMAKTNLDLLNLHYSSSASQLASLKEIMPDSELVDQLEKRIDSPQRQITQSPNAKKTMMHPSLLTKS